MTGRRVVLRRCESPAEAELWAAAFRSVLTSLDIAGWWRVRIDPADQGALLVGVDYTPAVASWASLRIAIGSDGQECADYASIRHDSTFYPTDHLPLS